MRKINNYRIVSNHHQFEIFNRLWPPGIIAATVFVIARTVMAFKKQVRTKFNLALEN